jgi:hypothetical protein
LGFATIGDKGIPVVIHLSLILAIDRERNTLIVLESHSTIESLEPIAIEFERYHDGMLGQNPRVWEDVAVVLSFGKSVVFAPEAEGDWIGHKD